MAKKEGSVAPKERINIKYKPELGDATVDVELPLKLFMIGDYTLREDDTPLEDRKPIEVDKDNFNDVMRAQKLSLDINVKNRLAEDEKKSDSGEPAEMPVKLKFETLKDFHPEQIARQVPDLKKLLELREALVALKGPLGNLPAFRKRIQDLLEQDDQRQKLMDELLGNSQKS